LNKTLKIFLGIIITAIVLALSGGIEITIKSIFDSIPMGVGNQIGILIISILLIFFFSKRRIIEFNVARINLKQLVKPIVITVLLLIIRELISVVLGSDSHPAAISMSTLQQVIFIVVLASLSEELLFRGFLQNMLNPIRRYGIIIFNLNLSLPVIISGILFGLMHFALMGTGASFNYVLQIAIFGMLLGMIAGYFQEKHNNFSFAFIVHMTGNLVGLIFSIVR
jgi:membrane protease YdiL (CAAX protease family)